MSFKAHQELGDHRVGVLLSLRRLNLREAQWRHGSPDHCLASGRLRRGLVFCCTDSWGSLPDDGMVCTCGGRVIVLLSLSVCACACVCPCAHWSHGTRVEVRTATESFSPSTLWVCLPYYNGSAFSAAPGVNPVLLFKPKGFCSDFCSILNKVLIS